MAKIIVAKNAGFCPGVKSAIDTVIELSKKNSAKIYTLGPLIHNKEVIKSLENKNIFSIENPDSIEENSILVIRAHGIPPELENAIRNKKLTIIDCTCPLVKNVHKVIEKYNKSGYTTVIVGDKDHAEVIGLIGYAKNNYFVVSNLKEARELPELNKVNVVSQTTQEEEVFFECVKEIEKKAKEIIISNTICNPTKLRQKETYQMSRQADMVIVVGGKHSANTSRLFSICSKLASRAILVENENEITKDMIKGNEKIFITAGASTPNWLIERVHEKIKKLTIDEKVYPDIKNILEFLVNSGIYTAIAASFLTLLSSKIFIPNSVPYNFIPKKLLLSSSLFVLSLHVINRALNKDLNVSLDKMEILFIKFDSTIKFLAYLSGLISLILAYTINLEIFILISLIWAIGILYSYSISERTNKIPCSKDIILALGWTFACSIMPLIWIKEKITNIIFYQILFIFLISLVRSILLSIAQDQNDMLIGKESIYKNFKKKNISLFIYFTNFVYIFIVLYTSTLLKFKNLALLFLALLYYPILYFYFNKGKIPDKINSEILIDFQFMILGLSSLLF
jgi:4-hydroxy-3-methylbut-2-enyl diphosphate reductase